MTGPVTGPGWHLIGPDPRIAAWAHAAQAVAQAAISASPEPWRCGGTWFVGVDALPNTACGAVAGVPFPWDALPLGRVALHRAQLSTLRPGYPQPSPDETASAFRFRQTRDAAHLDGLLPIGPDRRRMIREPHAWILGLPLTDTPAAPLVVWEGSHRIMASALRAALAPYPPQDWADIDVTDAYTAARARVFETCQRVELPAAPSEATLLHRLMVHGVAPWAASAPKQPERIIAYFRPLLSSVADWLADP